jgi:hypothetical protein
MIQNNTDFFFTDEILLFQVLIQDTLKILYRHSAGSMCFKECSTIMHGCIQ